MTVYPLPPERGFIMDIINTASAGTLESSDCLVTVRPGSTVEVHLESVILKRYGQHLSSLVNETLHELSLSTGIIEINDCGALDYCIKARLVAAVKRGASAC
jgi:citrate lyase subunit gamma (acyl carrier protein)